MPPIRETHRTVVRSFLTHCLSGCEKNADELRTLTRTNRDPTLLRQFEYAKNSVSILKWLLALNQQRASHVEVS